MSNRYKFTTSPGLSLPLSLTVIRTTTIDIGKQKLKYLAAQDCELTEQSLQVHNISWTFPPSLTVKRTTTVDIGKQELKWLAARSRIRNG